MIHTRAEEKLTQCAHKWHPDRPGEFDILDVLADDLAIGSLKAL